MSTFNIPLIIRGKVIEDDWVQFGGRSGSSKFLAPDPRKYLDQLPLGNPIDMKDLYDISFDDILDVLEELGKALNFDSNSYIKQAYDAALEASPYPASMLKGHYTGVSSVFNRKVISEIAEERIGLDYLEGWVSRTLQDGRQLRLRAFGSRSLHIPAGNGAIISAVTVIRNAITRSDGIIKIPSNDPLTATAIARTLAEVAPNHPLTRHLTVGYWKGGDVEVEKKLYRPSNLEKIIAWGGFASVKHVTQYVQPGLELISLDPKRSATIIGPEAFESEEVLEEVAMRTACDIGMANQEGCACARVVYVLCGTDTQGIDNINRLGQLIYRKLQELPTTISTKVKYFDRQLRDHMDATRTDDTFFRIIGGEENEGAIIVSQFDEAVDYSYMLSGRVANLVPVDDLVKVTEAVTAYTQTVGVYPESLKEKLRDVLPLFGAQRLTSLGYACAPSIAAPQDSIEPLRRMCKWIIEESCDPEMVTPMWKYSPDNQQ